MMFKTHKDVDFAVDVPGTGEVIYKTWGQAAALAIAYHVHTIDVLCWSRAGAAWAGLADEYDDDPDASVTCRYRIDDTGEVVDVIGRIA